MTSYDDCIIDEVPEIPDQSCVVSGADTISEIWLRQSDKPFTLLAKSPSNETYASQLARSLAAEVEKTGDDKLHVLKIRQGTMPKIAGTYKVNPLDNSQHNTDPTPMMWEWIDFRDNPDLWKWYAQVTGSEYEEETGVIVPNGKPVSMLGWAKNGENLLGGLNGYKGTMKAEPSIENGAEVANRIACSFNTQIIGTMPRRLRLP